MTTINSGLIFSTQNTSTLTDLGAVFNLVAARAVHHGRHDNSRRRPAAVVVVVVVVVSRGDAVAAVLFFGEKRRPR